MQERVGNFLAGLTSRRYEVRRRCRTVLQSRAEALPRDYRTDSQHPAIAHPTLVLVSNHRRTGGRSFPADTLELSNAKRNALRSLVGLLADRHKECQLPHPFCGLPPGPGEGFLTLVAFATSQQEGTSGDPVIGPVPLSGQSCREIRDR